MTVRFRICDLYDGHAVFESTVGSEIVQYWQESNRPGLDKWEIQVYHPLDGWIKMPAVVLEDWWAKARQAEYTGPSASNKLADLIIAIAKRKYPHRLMPWLDK